MDDNAFSAAVLEKLPLADAVWRLLHFTMGDAWLQDLWTRKRGRCYDWSFANMITTLRTKPQIAYLAIKMPGATWGHPGTVDHVMM